jgi:hypothetical protein
MRGIVAGLFALAVIGLPLLQSSAASANAIAGGGYSSSYAGESVFTNNAAGETGQMSAIFFNDGTQPWAPGVVGLLVCAADKTTCNVPSNQSFRSRWFSDRVYATVTSTVAPGQNGFFIYDFTVPAGTPPGTVTTFYGDVGLIATGAELRPEGYFQINTTPVPSLTLTLTPSPASVAVGSTQQFTLSGGPTGIDPTWSVTGGCGAITATGLFAATATNSASQPCTVVAKIAGTTAAAVVTVYGPAAALSCVANPAATVANGGGPGGTGTITIALKDINGNTVSNASTPSLRIANNTPALATVTPPDGLVTPSNGVVTLTYATTLVPGTIQVSASGTGVLGCNVMIASNAPGSGVATLSSFDPTIVASDGGSTSTLRVDVVDANGSRDVNDSSTVISVSRDSGANICTLSGGGGSATGTVVQGRATFTVVSSTTPGTCLWSATTNSSVITGSSATLTTQIVGAANRIGIVSNDSPHPAAAPGGSCAATGTNTNPSCTKVVVEVRDFNGVRLTGSTATLTATLETSSCTGAGGGSASAVGPTATAAAGRATFLFTSRGAYVACNITFSGSGLSGTNTTVAWTPQAADHLACVFTPASIFNDNTATSTADVAARDPLGNVVTGTNYSVTFSRQSGSSTVLVTASPQTMFGGHAYFTVRSTTTNGSDLYVPQIAPGGGALPNAPVSCSVLVHP